MEEPVVPGRVPRLMYRMSGAEAAAGFAMLLFASHWYDAFVGWVTSAVTYVLAASSERLERD